MALFRLVDRHFQIVAVAEAASRLVAALAKLDVSLLHAHNDVTQSALPTLIRCVDSGLWWAAGLLHERAGRWMASLECWLQFAAQCISRIGPNTGHQGGASASQRTGVGGGRGDGRDAQVGSLGIALPSQADGATTHQLPCVRRPG